MSRGISEVEIERYVRAGGKPTAIARARALYSGPRVRQVRPCGAVQRNLVAVDVEREKPRPRRGDVERLPYRAAPDRRERRVDRVHAPLPGCRGRGTRASRRGVVCRYELYAV